MAATIDDDTERLPFADGIGETDRQQRVVAEDCPTAGHDGIDTVADCMDHRPAGAGADPLTHAGLGSDFAVEAHRILPCQPWSLLLDAQKKRCELQADVIVVGGDLDAVNPVGIEDFCGTAMHPRVRVTHHKKHPGDARRNNCVGTWRGAPVECTWFESHIQVGTVCRRPSLQ